MALNIPDHGDEVSVVDRADANAMEGRVFDLGGDKVVILPEAQNGQLRDMAGRPLSSAMHTLASEGQVVLRVGLDEGETPNVGSITDLVRAGLSQLSFDARDLRVEVYTKPGTAIVEISRSQQAAPDLAVAAK